MALKEMHFTKVVRIPCSTSKEVEIGVNLLGMG
jgi:hypothetical protein